MGRTSPNTIYLKTVPCSELSVLASSLFQKFGPWACATIVPKSHQCQLQRVFAAYLLAPTNQYFAINHRGSTSPNHIFFSHIINMCVWLNGIFIFKSTYLNIYIYIHIYVWVLIFFFPERPFFANKNVTFANLSRTPCLSFAGPMLANNTSYEDSFATCQITPKNHRSLLGSLLNMQLASRNPFSGQILFAKFTGPPLSTCTLTFARSFA